jgi:hypothetical protein
LRCKLHEISGLVDEKISFVCRQSFPGAATETLQKKNTSHLKSLNSSKNVFKISLKILEKASISLEKSSKIFEIFIKAPYF